MPNLNGNDDKVICLSFHQAGVNKLEMKLSIIKFKTLFQKLCINQLWKQPKNIY